MATRKTPTPTTASQAPKKATVAPVTAQEQIQEQITPMPSIQAKIDRLSDFEGSKVKAFASANIGSFAVHGLRVVEGEKGMFVAMPSTSYQKNGKTEYQETFHPVSADARKALGDAVLQAYEQKLAEEQSEDESLNMQDTEDQALTQTM